MLKVMGQCLEEMRWSDQPQLVLELYALRLTQPFVDVGVLLKRIEELEQTETPHPIVSAARRDHPLPQGERGRVIGNDSVYAQADQAADAVHAQVGDADNLVLVEPTDSGMLNAIVRHRLSSP
jgi:hypothetical protein